MNTKISDVSTFHSNQNNNTSYIGNYLTANYSISKGDAYTASHILEKNLESPKLLEIKFISNGVVSTNDVSGLYSARL